MLRTAADDHADVAEREIDAFSYSGSGGCRHDMVGGGGDLKHRHGQCFGINVYAADPPLALARQIAGNPPATGNWPQQWPLIMAWIPIFIFLPLAIFLLDRTHTKGT